MSLTITTIVCYLANTLLIRYEFWGWAPIKLIAAITSPIKDTSPNVYTSFVKVWYTTVGLNIIMVRLIEIIFPHIPTSIWMKMKHHYNMNKAQNNKELTRYEAEGLLKTPQIDFGFVLARVNYGLFITLFFCSGIPILVPLFFIFLLVLYRVTRHDFVKYSTIPPLLDEALIQQSCTTGHIAIILHLIIGMVMYSEETIFASENRINLIGFPLSMIGLDKLVGRNIDYLGPNIIFLFLVLLVLFIVYLQKIKNFFVSQSVEKQFQADSSMIK